jgi:hypothetical protein
MTTLSEIKNYFGVKMATPNRNATVEVQLTQKEKQILFDIGLPEVNTGGGVDSLIFNDLSIYKDIYIPIYKSSLTPDDLWICLNTDTHEIASVSFGEIQEQPLSLESFLFYIYIYITNLLMKKKYKITILMMRISLVSLKEGLVSIVRHIKSLIGLVYFGN